MSNGKKVTRTVALTGVGVALALIFSYVEHLLPLPIAVPGIKLGLANLVVLVALCLGKPKLALGLSCLRIVLAGLMFGNPAMMLYSLSGGLLSYGVMALAVHRRKLSVIGISMAGGVAHNVGQLLCAMAVMKTGAVAWYFPVLLPAGLLTGALLGLVAAGLLPRLKRII